MSGSKHMAYAGIGLVIGYIITLAGETFGLWLLYILLPLSFAIFFAWVSVLYSYQEEVLKPEIRERKK